VAIGGDVEAVRVEGYPHLGFLGSSLAFLGFGLEKAGDGLRHFPDLIVENTVDLHFGIGPSGGHGQTSLGRSLHLRRSGRRRGGRAAEKHEN
jgi:hypothetical protein